MKNSNHSNSDYFCIFAGGGVRGTSYIGVLNVLKALNINIRGFAGSSVGAIFASLHSIGYNNDEIYDIATSLNYEIFKDFYLPFGKSFGICKGDNLFNWIKNTLEKKFYEGSYKENENKPITFKDLDKDLIIIATDIKTCRFKEFSRYTTPDVEIAHAIRASASIPGFFKPVWDDESCLVDGDIIKNLPLWTVSKNTIPDNCRILEFRLEGSNDLREINNTFDYFNAVIDTSTNISTDFIIDLYGKKDRFDFIKINTGQTSIIDFSISKEHKKELIKIGADTTHEYFTKTLKDKKESFQKTYLIILTSLEEFQKQINKNHYQEAQLLLGEISLILASDKDYLNTMIIDALFSLKQLFIKNLTKSLIFNQWKLSGKNEIIAKIQKIKNHLTQEINEIEYYCSSINHLKQPKSIH